MAASAKEALFKYLIWLMIPLYGRALDAGANQHCVHDEEVMAR
jgi:hypothetical protein